MSWLNLVEFSKVSDRHQVARAEQLIDCAIPQIIFLQADFGAVIDKEDGLRRAGAAPDAPHIDAELAKVLLWPQPNSLRVLSAHQLFTRAAHPEIVSAIEGLTSRISRQIEKRRACSSQPASIHELMKRYSHEHALQRATRITADFLIISLFSNKKARLKQNDVIDILHGVVALSYCDFVLLDKNWRDKAERLRRALPSSFPMARCFSQKCGIHQLMSELEGASGTVASR